MKNVDLKRIVITGYKKTEYQCTEKIDLENPHKDTVIVKTAVTTISCGTERANLLGERVHGIPAGAFPRRVGYAGAGVVVSVGEDVKNIKVGDRVTYSWGSYQNYQVLSEKQVIKLPDEVSFSEAAFTFISTFPMAAIRKVKPELGESMLIMGLGLLGQIAVQFARAAGVVPVIAADPLKERRDEAIANGADYALDPLENNFAEKVKELTNGGVNTAIEVTGVGAGLNEALDCMKRLGRIALLGCTRDNNFTVDFYEKVHYPGITIVGAHTNARPDIESSAGLFTHWDDMNCSLNLIKGGRVDFKRLVKETHSLNEASEVFTRLANDKNFPIGVQFDWTKE